MLFCQLLSSVKASSLRLTKVDNDLYTAFRSHFPQLDISRLDVDLIKSDEGKEVNTRNISFGILCSYITEQDKTIADLKILIETLIALMADDVDILRTLSGISC